MRVEGGKSVTSPWTCNGAQSIMVEYKNVTGGSATSGHRKGDGWKGNGQKGLQKNGIAFILCLQPS